MLCGSLQEDLTGVFCSFCGGPRCASIDSVSLASQYNSCKQAHDQNRSKELQQCCGVGQPPVCDAVERKCQDLTQRLLKCSAHLRPSATKPPLQSSHVRSALGSLFSAHHCDDISVSYQHWWQRPESENPRCLPKQTCAWGFSSDFVYVRAIQSMRSYRPDDLNVTVLCSECAAHLCAKAAPFQTWIDSWNAAVDAGAMVKPVRPAIIEEQTLLPMIPSDRIIKVCLLHSQP